MREYLTILLVGLALSLSGAVLAAQAAEAKGTSERTEAAPKAQTCRPKWPYIVLTCNA